MKDKSAVGQCNRRHQDSIVYLVESGVEESDGFSLRPRWTSMTIAESMGEDRGGCDPGKHERD